MELWDGELLLRRFRPEDRDALAALADNIKVSQYLNDSFPHPYTVNDAEGWIASASAESRLCNFAMECDGRFVGGIGLQPMADVHSGTSLVGYWLGEPYWGRGITTRALRLITAYAFDELLFLRLQACVFAGNPASIRVLEKCGYVREGVMRKHVRKNGVIMDAVLYAKLRNDTPGE